MSIFSDQKVIKLEFSKIKDLESPKYVETVC